MALLVVALGALPARADTAPVPEQVSEYFATGLVPRLIDLYGPEAGSTTDTKAGQIVRVHEWTAPFLAGTPTKLPTQLTNSWVAPVLLKDQPLGLAIVWINPATRRCLNWPTSPPARASCPHWRPCRRMRRCCATRSMGPGSR